MYYNILHFLRVNLMHRMESADADLKLRTKLYFIIHNIMHMK